MQELALPDTMPNVHIGTMAWKCGLEIIRNDNEIVISVIGSSACAKESETESQGAD